MLDGLWMQAAVYTAVSLGGIVLLAWWLFWSPVSASPARAVPVTDRMARTFALMIGVGALLISVGGYWDASEHVVTGIVPGGDDFLWPPHLMLYAGFLLSFLVAAGGLFTLARPNLQAGIRDPRLWARRNPAITAVALVAGYGLTSIPGDAIWHELYGVDLTAWSPPHIFLAAASSATAALTIGLLLKGNIRSDLERYGRSRDGLSRDGRERTAGNWLKAVALFYLVLGLSEANLIAVLEWEIGTVGGYVAQRPVWLYPLLVGALAYFTLVLARRLVPGPWTATITALLYFGWRLAVTTLTETISGGPPRLTLVFIVGAVLLDLVAQRSRSVGARNGPAGAFVTATAFTAGYILFAIPTVVLLYGDQLPPFRLVDHLVSIVGTIAVCTLLHPLAVVLAGWLRNSAQLSVERERVSV